MTPSLKCILLTIICVIIRYEVGTNSLDKKANFGNNTDTDTYYNIYAKINSLEKKLKNLETRMQRRTKLLQQIMHSFIEMDSNEGMPDKGPKKQTRLATTNTVNSLY